MQNKTKSVHFASQDTQHIISPSNKSPSRTLIIEDETQTPSQLSIPEKSMKLLQDSSNLRPDKQLTKLAKDGVIFLRASSNNNNIQRTNALKLRNIMIKLLTKYQFVEKIPHPNYDTSKKTVANNDWIPTHAIKPLNNSLKAVFVGSVGCNEPKWRSFWKFCDNFNNSEDTQSENSKENSLSIAPESQSSLYTPPPPILTQSNNKKQVQFSDLSDEDKKTIYDWAVKRDQTIFIKDKIKEIFNNYASTDSNLDWNISIVNPLWFRIQSVGSILHADIPYMLGHTNILKQISGQKLLISGIDMMHKQSYIGKKSKILRQKLLSNGGTSVGNDGHENECPLCGYVYNQSDSEEKQLKTLETENESSEHDASVNDNPNKPYHSFCSLCCDNQYGLYTVWTALDEFDTPFDSGSIIFALGSHIKYKGVYEATLNNASVPIGYSKKNEKEKSNIKWGYVNNIRPGDMFIFNIKTLHASSKSNDGLLRARIDMRVAIKVSNKRYVKELNEIKIGNSNSNNGHLGLSQLCSQPASIHNNIQKETETEVLSNTVEMEQENDSNSSPEFNTNINISKHLSFDNINNCNGKKGILKRSLSTNDINMNHNNGTKDVSIQDLPTQEENDSPLAVVNDVRKKTLTPQDITEHDDGNEYKSPVKGNVVLQTPPSNRSLAQTPVNVGMNNNNGVIMVPETQYNDNILPTQMTQMTQQTQSIPRLENQNRYNNNSNSNNNNNGNVNGRKRMFSNMDTRILSQTSMENSDNNGNNNNNGNMIMEPPNKRPKLLHGHGNISGYNGYNNMNNMNITNIRHFTTISDEELCNKISIMRNRVNKSFNQLQTQMNETLDLMEVANERYLYTKQKEKQERDRANHFQNKNQDLQKKVMENHSILFKMFEQ